MQLTKGKISKILKQKKQSHKKYNKKKYNKNNTFRHKKKCNLANKSLKKIKYRKAKRGGATPTPTPIPITDNDDDAISNLANVLEKTELDEATPETEKLPELVEAAETNNLPEQPALETNNLPELVETEPALTPAEAENLPELVETEPALTTSEAENLPELVETEPALEATDSASSTEQSLTPNEQDSVPASEQSSVPASVSASEPASVPASEQASEPALTPTSNNELTQAVETIINNLSTKIADKIQNPNPTTSGQQNGYDANSIASNIMGKGGKKHKSRRLLKKNKTRKK
jgi:hypothetical protein